jgi:hypothetical protein
MTERSGQAVPGISAVAAGRPSRRTLRRAGLLVGAGAAAGGLASATFPVTAQAATDRQFGWAYCDNCKGLYYSAGKLGSTALGVCPYHGGDNPGHSGHTYNYGLQYGHVPGVGLQNGWKYCGNCKALFYGPSGTGGRCPVGLFHEVTQAGSYDYNLSYGYAGYSGFQDGWDWCANCAGLFYNPDRAYGWCPVSFTQILHNGTGSYQYDLTYG